MTIQEKQKFDREFEKLYEEYFSYLVKYLLTIVHDFSSAEDIAHDVFLRIYKNRKIPPSDLARCKSYMIKSAKNMAIDYLRKQKRDERKMRRVIPEWDEKTDLSDNIENIVIEGCIISTVNEVLSDFPERNRKIFIEGVIENRCLNNLSAKGGLSRYKVRRIQTEIVYRLKEKLKDYL
ncbi:MAG TPA: sigma-70 family RNA polymerase sigma factor [Spirochaetota bacterium]|nr:sigma-70 family RNA polymerase sigma factor [Spirochaetota bacterium]